MQEGLLRLLHGAAATLMVSYTDEAKFLIPGWGFTLGMAEWPFLFVDFLGKIGKACVTTPM